MMSKDEFNQVVLEQLFRFSTFNLKYLLMIIQY